MKKYIIIITVFFCSSYSSDAQKDLYTIWSYTIQRDSNALKAKDYSAVTILYFANADIIDLPNDIIFCKNVKKVNLLGNQNLDIEKVLEQLNKLPNLDYLMLNSCQLKILPPSIGKLNKLKRLELVDNEFSILPMQLSNLDDLEYLSLTRCKNLDIKQVIKVVKGCKRLKELNMMRVHVDELPKCIHKLSSLEILDLRFNNLKTLPCVLNKMEKLRIVYTDNNPIEYLPMCMKEKKYLLPMDDKIFREK